MLTEPQRKAMFSSDRDDWETPQDFFEIWDKLFHFDLDAAANTHNAKCDRYFTVEDDALTQNWGGAYCLAQSTLWQEHWQMGKKGLRGKHEAKHVCCLPPPCQNGYGMVPRLLPPWVCAIHSRAAQVWQLQKLSAVPIYARIFWTEV